MVFIVIFLVEIVILFFLSRQLTRLLSRHMSIQAISILFLPGIIVHELSHLLIAGLLFVPIGEIEFVPKRTEEGVKLGSVGIGKTDPIRRAIIGVAPILVGILILFGVGSYLVHNSSMVQIIEPATIGMAVLFLYLIFSVGNTMFSSPRDLEGFLEVVAFLGFLVLTFYVFMIISGRGVSFPIPLDRIGMVLNPVSLTLGIAIALDSLLILLLRSLLGRS